MIEAKILFANLVILSFIFVSASALSRNEIAISATHDHHGVSVSDDEVDGICVYTLYVRTSSTFLGGTDSIISIKLSDETGSTISIDNLETWGGLMGEGHNYYERGNLDIFTGRSPCLRRPVCAMRLESDGSNFSHSWFCNYVEVTVTGPDISCAQQLFTVDEWLSRDRGPKQLYAIRDNCNTTSHFSRAHSMESQAQ